MRICACAAWPCFQLDSFDEFIMNTMQEIVDECAQLHLVPQQQHNPMMQASGGKSYKITFGQIYLSKPTWVEPDQTTSAMFPNEARLRNLTYAAPLYMDLQRATVTVDADGQEDEEEEEFSKVFLGQVPIMLRSTYCILSESNDRELTDLGECPYDQGGYFVINGSEKVSAPRVHAHAPTAPPARPPTAPAHRACGCRRICRTAPAGAPARTHTSLRPGPLCSSGRC
jgi:DNA-directed RNA polymerase beta subunit